MNNRFIRFLALFIFLLPGIVVAQQYYDPGLLQRTIDRKPVIYQAPGVRLGSFMLRPGAELAYENNNNIFYLDRVKVSDDIFHIRPWFNLNSDWSRHELNFNFYADIAKYNNFGNEDYEDWVASINGRFDVKRGSDFNYKASYMQLHEARTSPDGRRGIRPNKFSFSGFDVGYHHNFNRLTAALNYHVTDTNYDNNVRIDGSILDNQYRNRQRDALLLRVDYALSTVRRNVFFSAEGNNVNYDQKFDNAGFERSSDGYRLRGGVSWDENGIIQGDLYVEYIEQKYDDPRFKKINGFGIGAKLDWTPTKLTNVNLIFRNAPQETTQLNSSGYYSSLYSVRVQHEIRRNWLVNARASYTNNDYGYNGTDPDALTRTKVTRAGAGVSYLFNRNMYITGGYIYEKQNANVSRFDYGTNRWFITLGAEL